MVKGRVAPGTATWLKSLAGLVIERHIDERGGASGAFAVVGPTKADRLRGQWGGVEPYARSLSPRQRQVVKLRFREGMCYATIAGRLGIPIGTVRSRLARARIAIDALSRGSTNPVDASRGEAVGPGPVPVWNDGFGHSAGL